MTVNIPSNKPLTIFPDLPREKKLIDEKGNMHKNWKSYFDQLTAALQINFKPEGHVIPTQTTSNITQLSATESKNNIIYDSTVNGFKGNVNQTWILFSMITNYAGDPNTHVAGQLYWLCWNTVGHILYICTTAGNAASAVWTAV